VINGEYFDTREAGGLLNKSAAYLFSTIHAGHVTPPAQSFAGRYAWSSCDIERVRAELAALRRDRPHSLDNPATVDPSAAELCNGWGAT
jgi:hypothetical protein